MQLLINTLSENICSITINELSNIYVLICDAIIQQMEWGITFTIIFEKENKQILHNYLLDNNTIELENYITDIYNSSKNTHILYIIKEYYNDHKNRSLIDYKHYLDYLPYQKFHELILSSPDLLKSDKYLIQI